MKQLQVWRVHQYFARSNAVLPRPSLARGYALGVRSSRSQHRGCFCSSISKQQMATQGKLQRHFEPVFEQRGDPAHNFTVLQWNTLADGLAQHGDFVKAPAKALQWERRAPLLLQEILEADADVICLQEVNHYEDFFKPELADLGYEGLFLAKCDSAAAYYGFPADGCAMFYRSARYSVTGRPSALPFCSREGKDENQGMLQLHLLDKVSGKALIVASAHLKAKPGPVNDAIRKRQCEQMLQRLASSRSGAVSAASSNGASPSAASSNGNGASPSCRPQVLLCGDFNTTPDSDACELLEAHPLGLRSLWQDRCGADAAAAAELCFTTWKYRPEGESQRIIDYVWYAISLPG